MELVFLFNPDGVAVFVDVDEVGNFAYSFVCTGAHLLLDSLIG